MAAGPERELSRRIRALSGLSDPQRQVVLSTELMEELRVAELRVSQIRDAAMVRLYDGGLSYQEIAVIAGLTRGRVAQVVQRSRRKSAG